MSARKTSLAKLVLEASHRHNAYTVFADFVEMAAISMSNAMDVLQAPAREQRNLQIMAKYDKADQARFPRMFGELVEQMSAGLDDVLGKVFGELELGNSRAGQFFTPFELCRLMASITVGDGAEMRSQISRKGFVTAQEPACGAGAQIIALAEAMKEAGLNYQQQLHVTAIDVDARAVHMTYLQLSLMHIPAVVIFGNTLTLEQRARWYTPAHILGLWDVKLRRGCTLGSPMDEEQRAATTKEPAPQVPAVVDPAGQIGLFDEVAA